MRVELRTEARNDIFDAASFYEIQREGLGNEFVESVFADLAVLELQAGVHRKINGCHRKLTTRFPYGIYYLVDSSIVDVVAILHCRENPETRDERLNR
ncbi:MAG: plasmid stabilization system protein ParE [Pirellulaceae bacterium]|jgi:plasmid stabilization system protein ParE